MDVKHYNEIVEALNELELDNVEKLEDNEPSFKMEYAFESITESNSKFKRRIAHA